MMNQENTQTTINSTLTESVKSMASAVQELVELIKNEIAAEATSTTTETTATTTTDTEATETTTIGYLPCPPDAKTAEATTTVETTTEATTEITATADEATETTYATADETPAVEPDETDIDLDSVYSVLKYALHHEGRNEERDRSPYAPDHNVMADIGHCCKIYLAQFNDEISIIIKHRDYASPLMRKTITKLGDFKEQENPALLLITGSVKAEPEIKRFFDVYGYIKDLIINK